MVRRLTHVPLEPVEDSGRALARGARDFGQVPALLSEQG